MPDVKRMVSVEQKEFINMIGAMSQLAFAEDSLGKRMKTIPRAWWRYRGVLCNLGRLVNDLTRSMPKEQQDHIRKQMPAIKMIVGVDYQLPRYYDSTYGRWLSFEDLNVVATAIRNCCLTCSINDPQEQKQCPYCKLLEVLPTDKPDESSNGCGYFTIW